MGRSSVEYKAWENMLSRCRNPKMTEYANYGGRGIVVCSRWHQFVAFLADMGTRPSSDYSLDRIDVNGHYEPGNCRWATRQQQANNTRTNRIVTFNGCLYTLAQLSRLTGVAQYSLTRRLNAGLTVEQAVAHKRWHPFVQKTHCKRGHALDASNIYYYKGQRYACRMCAKLRGAKMGRLSRRKGAAFERHVAKRFSKLYPTKRGLGQARAGGEVADVTGIPGVWVECKCQAKPAPLAALRQAEEAIVANGCNDKPLVICRENHGRDIAVLYLDDYLALLERYEAFAREDAERKALALSMLKKEDPCSKP